MLGAGAGLASLVDLEAKETLSRVPDEDGFSIHDRYDILGDVGGGAYGTVYKARNKAKPSQIVALKKMYITEDPEIGIPPLVMREVTNLRRLSEPPNKREPYIVRLLDVLQYDGRFENEYVFYMVFEYMDKDLDHYIRQCSAPGMDEGNVKDFLMQILCGVDWMHMNNIVHRDLKPQNILVSRDGKSIKIADFGLSRMIGSNVVLSTQVITQWYRAPEVLLHSSYNKEVDIWSVGCIFAEMLTGRPLFESSRPGEKAQLDVIFSIIGTPSLDHWPPQSAVSSEQFLNHKPIPWPDMFPEHRKETHNLLGAMLKFEGAERVTAERALQHNYFSDLHSLVSPGCEATTTCEDCHSSSSRSSGSASPSSSSSTTSTSILSTSTDSGIQDS